MTTEIFFRSRLVIARRSRGLTQSDLAAAIGKSQRDVSHYESSARGVGPETIDALASVLKYPRAFFSAGDVELMSEKDASFRARRTMPAWLRHKALAYGLLASSCVSAAFQHRYNLPPVDVPEDLQGETPESAAAVTRDLWTLSEGPVDNVVHLLESKGIQVFWLDEHDIRVDAFSFWHDGEPYILLNSPAKSGDRMRFNAAHELGHLVLHRNSKTPSGRAEETEAHDFAAAFLLPSYEFDQDCPNTPELQPFVELKKRWRVSIQAMLHRAWRRQRLTDWQYKLANIELAHLGWRTREPVPIQPEASRLHRLIFSIARQGHHARGVRTNRRADRVG